MSERTEGNGSTGGGEEQRARRRPGRVVLVLLGALVLVAIAGLAGFLAPTWFYGLGGGLVASLLIAARNLLHDSPPRANQGPLARGAADERAGGSE